MKTVILLLVFGLALASSSALPTFPNIEYLGYGYDVVHANPATCKADPGWRIQSIFQLTFALNHTYDNKFAVPDDANVADTPSCSYQGSSQVMTSAEQYQHALSKSLDVQESVKFKFLGITLGSESFSSSSQYQALFKGGRSSTKSYTGTSAKCIAYAAEWNSFDFHPTLTTNFQDAVAGLGPPGSYLKFVQTFGTNYVQGMSMGGSSFAYSTFDTTSVQSLVHTESSQRVEGSAGLDFIVHAHGSITSASSQEMSDYKAYNSTSHSYTACGIPEPAPPCSGDMCKDFSAWVAKVQLPDGQPLPVKTTLVSIVELLTPDFFPHDAKITAKQEGLANFLNSSYCGEVPNCGPPPPPPPPPNGLWGQFLHDSHHTGLSEALLGPAGPGVYVKWKHGSFGPIRSSPAVALDGTVYVGSNDGNLTAFDPATGAVKWQVPTGWMVISSPAIGPNDTVYVGSFDGKVYAVNGTSGALLWTRQTGAFVISSPTVDLNGTVYIGSDDAKLYALNGTTGAVLWTFTTGDHIQSSPAIGMNGAVYFGSDDGKVYAVNATTYALLWSTPTGGPVGSSPSEGPRGVVYIGSDDSKVYALDSTTGAVMWSYPTGGAVKSSPVIGDNNLVYVGVTGGCVALNGTTGAQVWSAALGGSAYSSPAVDGEGILYLGGNDFHIYALDAGSGTVCWNLTTGGSVQSSPGIGANGIVYVGSDDGGLYAVHDKV